MPYLGHELIEPVCFRNATGFFLRVYRPVSMQWYVRLARAEYVGLRRVCGMKLDFDPARLV